MSEAYDNDAVWWADGGDPCSSCLRPSAIGCSCERDTALEDTTSITSWERMEDREHEQDIIDRERDRAADRQAFYARQAQHAKAKAAKEQAELAVDRSDIGVAEGVSYSIAEAEAGRTLRQLRLDAEAAHRAHVPGADSDADD